MKRKKIKKRMIAHDADYLIFMCTEGKDVKTGGFKAKRGGFKSRKKYKEPLKKYKDKLKVLIQDVEDQFSVNFVGQVKGIKPIFSDPNGNFRYDIYPEYKGERPERTKLFYRLRKWALKKYGYTKGIEADDEVAYLVDTKGWFGASMDKDLWRGIAGDWLNVHYMSMSFVNTSEGEARNFNLIQTLMGDPTDNIKALPKKAGGQMIPIPNLPKGQRQPFKVTEKLAIELLDNFGWHWEGVVKSYESKGFTEKDAIFTRQLICMRQWHPKKGIRLWQPKNE